VVISIVVVLLCSALLAMCACNVYIIFVTIFELAELSHELKNSAEYKNFVVKIQLITKNFGGQKFGAEFGYRQRLESRDE